MSVPPWLWSSGYGHGGNAVVQRSAILALVLDSARCSSFDTTMPLLGYFKVDGKINRKEEMEPMKLPVGGFES
jgi:hypothetical protein